MATRLVVEPKGVYGRELFYPKSETAAKLCELLGAKAFTRAQLVRIKELGFDVIILQPASMEL